MATLTVTNNTSSAASLPVGKPVRMVTQVVDFSSFTKQHMILFENQRAKKHRACVTNHAFER